MVFGNLDCSGRDLSLDPLWSATSGSRELIAIFLAMIIGLAAGSGHLYWPFYQPFLY